MPAKVLIPVDGARNSKAAEEYAVELNKKMPLQALLLNIIDTSDLDGHGIDPGYKESIIATKRKYSEKSLAEAAEILKKGGVEFEKRILTGAPNSMICYTAQSEDFDMVLITESGMTEFQDWLSATVTSYVLYHCRTPVLLVKHKK